MILLIVLLFIPYDDCKVNEKNVNRGNFDTFYAAHNTIAITFNSTSLHVRLNFVDLLFQALTVSALELTVFFIVYLRQLYVARYINSFYVDLLRKPHRLLMILICNENFVNLRHIWDAY